MAILETKFAPGQKAWILCNTKNYTALRSCPICGGLGKWELDGIQISCGGSRPLVCVGGTLSKVNYTWKPVEVIVKEIHLCVDGDEKYYADIPANHAWDATFDDDTYNAVLFDTKEKAQKMADQLNEQ